MRPLSVWVLVGVVALAAGCSSGSAGPSLVVEGSAESAADGAFAVAVGDDVPVGDMVVAGASGDSDGVLVLVSAAVDSLTVRWAESFAPTAAGFRLQWRERPAGDGEEVVWWGVDLGAGGREYTITGLVAGTRYRLRLTALDADGNSGEFAVANFETLAPPVRNLTGTAVAHDAVTLTWDSPAGWAPVGYVVQWRLRGPNEVLGRLELPAGRRSQLVTGLTGGTEYVFRLTARTAAGWQSKPAAIGFTTLAAPANDLTLEISAPHHCITGEGRSRGHGSGGPEEDRYWVREGVATVPVQWRISGGEGPYVVRVAETETTGTTGTTDVTCAKAGIDLNNLKDPDIDVVESGPKTIALGATDATGATTTRTHTIEIIQHASTAGNFYKGNVLTSGRTYYEWGRFFETPEGLTIADSGMLLAETFDGPRQYHLFRHVVDGDRHTEAAVDMFTGERFGMWVSTQQHPGSWTHDFSARLTAEDIAVWDTFFASVRFTPFPAGDPRNEAPVPLATEPRGAASAQQQAARVCRGPQDDVVELKPAHLWRPYGQLPNGLQGLRCSEMVIANPRLLNGEEITVCVEGAIHDDLFNLPAGLFTGALDAAAGDWNTLLGGLGRDALKFDSTAPACPADLTTDNVSYIRVIDWRNCQVMRMCPHNVAGSVVVTHQPEPLPRVEWNTLLVFRSVGAGTAAKREELKRVFRHELGHFLGLADYGSGCWRLIDDTATVQASLMSYGQLRDADGNPLLQPDGPADPTALDPPGCGSAATTTRDLDDLHAIYHPDAVTVLTLRHTSDGASVLSWSPPAVTPSEYNAASLGVFQRALLTRDALTGAPAGPGVWGLITTIAPAEDDHMLSGDVGGLGVRGGGPDRRRSSARQRCRPVGCAPQHRDPCPVGSAGRVGRVDPRRGVRRRVRGGAGGVYTLGFDGFGQLHFGEDAAGQWRFSVHDSTRTVSGIPLGAGDLLISYRPTGSSDPDPFDPARFVSATIRYGATTVTATGCRTRTTSGGAHFCRIDNTNFSIDPADVPLRLVIATAPGATGSSPMAGDHELDRNIAGFVNYGATGPGEWRFAFWATTVTNLGVTHGSPVTLRPGDIVISHARPWGPNGFADSPFDAGRFAPLRITHGDATIGATACTAHFYNVDRYECHIAGVFTFDNNDIPADIAVNPGATTTAGARSADGQPDQTHTPRSTNPFPTTCTTADLDCGKTGSQN